MDRAPGWQVAQVNIARFKAPIDSPLIAGFVERLDPINALADDAPGFVWRLQTEEGNATSIHAFEDDLILVNMSVWESVEDLNAFVYRSPHFEVFRRRREWTEHMDRAYLALWWIHAGTIPTVEEGKRRLDLLIEHGPTSDAFTFKRTFPAPASEAEAPVAP
ncbi:MAG TPA: DUF3291 domain-containing protein [Actinomycetota bacterium]|jgi:hypothetical protein|nr:DUF3291 domain-containing protein [Actinomycetota bacterium]